MFLIPFHALFANHNVTSSFTSRKLDLNSIFWTIDGKQDWTVSARLYEMVVPAGGQR